MHIQYIITLVINIYAFQESYYCISVHYLNITNAVFMLHCATVSFLASTERYNVLRSRSEIFCCADFLVSATIAVIVAAFWHKDQYSHCPLYFSQYFTLSDYIIKEKYGRSLTQTSFLHYCFWNLLNLLLIFDFYEGKPLVRLSVPHCISYGRCWTVSDIKYPQFSVLNEA